MIRVKIISDDYNYTINKIIKNKIFVKDIIYSNAIYLTINEKDYKKLSRILLFNKVVIIKNFGIKHLVYSIKNNLIDLLLWFFGIILFLFLNNIIVNIDVISKDSKITSMVTNALEKEGIKRLTLKKDYKDIQKIKERILNKYQDNIEWLSIENIGMKYVVIVEKRVLNKNIDNKSYCNLIAIKDSYVKKIYASKGEVLVKENSHVKKGDILISGLVKLNDEEKGKTCASGIIYGEGWYTVSVSIPINKVKKSLLNKKRYNISISNNNKEYVIFKNRIKNFDREKKEILSIFGISFNLLKDREVTEEKYSITETEAINEALLKASEEINFTLSKDEYISYKKVLKNSINDSTIDVEVFVATNEVISAIDIKE